MRKTARLLAILLSASGLTVPVAADEVNVTGRWKLTLQTPRGERTSRVTFLQEGEMLTVTSRGPQGVEVKSTGTVTLGEVRWTTMRQTQKGEVVVTYVGKVEGAKITGTMDSGRGRIVPWTAERVSK